ncbi:MAG: superfamily II DNA or RNA helicase [Bacteroidia bacterium]|jgi:superfamily II DNA or RNA helicase
MKIPATASYELAYSISRHAHLGPTLEAYVIQLTSAGNMSMVNQRVHSKNADYYDKKIEANDYKALALLDECLPEYIVKRFSKVKKIRPSEFFAKHFDAVLYEKQIRPHIEERQAQVMELIKGRQIFIKKLTNVIHEPIEWCHEPATALFHLRRNENNTHYFATIKHNNHRVPFAQNHAILLTRKPCYMVAGGRILYFEDGFNGQKLQPFICKRFIEIPKRSEEEYFRKVIVPLIEEHNVFAVGFDILTEKHQAKPVIKLQRLVNSNLGLTLGFEYDNYIFPYHSSKYVSVHMDKNGESYAFKRIKRSKTWEDIKKQTLEVMGLVHVGGSEFGFEMDKNVSELIHWVTANRDDLTKAGFKIHQNLDKDYSLEASSIELVATETGDWFDVKAKVILGGVEIEITKLRQAILNDQTSVTLPNGRTAIIPERWIEQIKGLALFSQSSEKFLLKKHHVGLIKPFLSPPEDLLDNKSISDFDGITDTKLPEGFIGSLRPYQKAGFDWLCFLYDMGFGGCLADDMGLGKTVQSLAFLQLVKERSIQSDGELSAEQGSLFNSNATSAKTALLVVPTSLIYNWVQEASNFTPELIFHNHVGMNRAKDVQLFSTVDVVITTYGTLRNDIDLFKTFEFDTVILDESQFIKNPTSQLAKKITQLNSNIRLTLTGTPIENTIVDLWSQMNFINPGLLGNHKFFVKEYVQPIEKLIDKSKSEELQQIIKPFLMRRTKFQVAHDLPPKTEQIIYCDMTEEQQDVYEKTKSTYRNMILDAINENGLAKSRIQILSGLTKLRQIANHPVLSDADYEASSGKFQEIEQRLTSALDQNHTLLIFSQFVGHLSLVQALLKSKGIEYCYLDGSVPAKERKKEVDAFQNGEKRVFLISLKAGGFGLNLTAADYVFMLDPWWNPAAENQAIDRTHRIGQTQNVFSYKFVTNNTVEEKIIKLQQKKQSLSDGLIKTEESYLKQVTLEDLQQIFS